VLHDSRTGDGRPDGRGRVPSRDGMRGAST
jgi:hypothetical protein